jgi:hypothetical protein
MRCPFVTSGLPAQSSPPCCARLLCVVPPGHPGGLLCAAMEVPLRLHDGLQVGYAGGVSGRDSRGPFDVLVHHSSNTLHLAPADSARALSPRRGSQPGPILSLR